jgi:carboxy-terminal domain RNA polymerase II polypeptide A small phosphatase
MTSPFSSVESNTDNTAAALDATQSSLNASGSPHDDEQPSYSTNDSTDGPKKNRGLLHVPSRSSSHKIQPSPTSTGLSGATASDPTGSIGRRSKESKTSILGRRRTGSVASSKRSTTSPVLTQGTGGRVDAANSQSSPMEKPKKHRGFLEFLNCCGVPDDANGVESDEPPLPVKRVSKISSQAPITTSNKPTTNILELSGNRSTVPLLEKESLRQTEFKADPTVNLDESSQHPPRVRQDSGSLGRKPSSKDTRNQQPLPAVIQDAEKPVRDQESSNPTVVIQAPATSPSQQDDGHESSPVQVKDDTPKDIAMTDTSAVPAEDAKLQAANQNERLSSTPTLPPPPPPPIPVPEPNRNANAMEDPAALDSAEEKQQWLLPPIEPRFHGKKCLVLDLDETLVHSSFKV